MADIRASFFEECEELLESLQDGLITMEGGGGDDETVNVCFRAIHSIKGGAGAFGLDDLVAYAHSYETVFEGIRSHRIVPDPDIMQLMFRAADMLSDVVQHAQGSGNLDEAALTQIVDELDSVGGAEEEEEAEVDFQVQTLELGDFGAMLEPEPPQGSDWSIVFRPTPALFSSGSEPLFLFRTLSSLGEMSLTPHVEDISNIEDHDPESAPLWWDIRLTSTSSEEEIAELFDFVDGLCTLTITKIASELPSEAEASLPELTPEPEPSPAPEEQPQPVDTAPAVSQEPKPAEKPAPAPAKSSGPSEAKAAAPAIKSTVRVDLDRIDRLVNLVGELVINQAMLAQSAAQAGLTKNSVVDQGLEEFLQLTRDIQDCVMMIRAQPVKSLFQRMSRIVREASQALGKRVTLVTEGEATEVDKTVIERLADPLTHMIRNAVDHGLETNADRLANGKPEVGEITLTAAHRSGRVIIEVADNGSGINREKVQQIAVNKGLIPAGANLSDTEVDNLIFMPGFSTATEVTDLSGRGVGMDVVRNAIQDLSGRVTIESTPGQGTKFAISLPLTLAVLDGMVVKSAGETLVMPLGSIQETLSLEDNELRILGPETSVLHVRDSFVPVLDLAAELGFRDPLDSYDGHVVLLISQENGNRAALIVDSIEEQRQVVIKGLEDSYGHVRGIAAATILGDGQVALILDPIDLMANASGRTRRRVLAEMSS